MRKRAKPKKLPKVWREALSTRPEHDEFWKDSCVIEFFTMVNGFPAIFAEIKASEKVVTGQIVNLKGKRWMPGKSSFPLGNALRPAKKGETTTIVVDGVYRHFLLSDYGVLFMDQFR